MNCSSLSRSLHLVDDEPVPQPRRLRDPHLCKGCGCRRARAMSRGTWRVLPDHDLCPQCWRDLGNQVRALAA